MHQWTILISLGAAALACFAAGWACGPQSAVLAANRRTERISTMLQAELKNAVEQVQNLLAQLHRTELERDDCQRRVTEIISRVDGILKERDKWQEFYTDQSVAHGNAQASMMDAIDYLEHRLKQAGVQVKLPDAIRLTQQLYYERHVQPLIESSAATVAKRPEPAPPSPDSLSTGQAQAQSSQTEKTA